MAWKLRRYEMPKYWFYHVHVSSTDPQETAEFYEKTFGAKRGSTGKLNDGRTLIDFKMSGGVIKVSSPRAKPMIPGTPQTGLEHFGLRTDNLDAAVKELKAKGIKFVQEVKVARPGVKVSFFLTPENTLVELMEIKE